MIRLIIWLKPFAIYLFAGFLITIITVSSIPSLPTLKIHTAKSEIRIDYLIHFCEYGLLAFLAFLSFADKNFNMGYRKFLLITLGLIAFALFDEFHQKIIPGRTFNVNDIKGNVLGIVAAFLFSIVLFREITRRFNKTD
jgi:VanZ family protein